MIPATKKTAGSKKKVAPKAAKKAAKPKSGPIGKRAAGKKAPIISKEVQEKKAPETKPSAKQEQKIAGIRIRLSAFDHAVLDEASLKIIDTAERSGAVVSGPVPLPTKIHKFTVNRSTFVHKDSRDQFEMRIHRRLIDLSETTFKTVDSLQNLSLPSGVNIEIKMS